MTNKAKNADTPDIETLRSRLTEAEEALQAISKGMIDAVVVRGPSGPRLVVTDLTVQKQVEAAEIFARSIIEQSTEAVVVCSAEGRITKASFAAERLAGARLEGRLLADALPMEVAPPPPALLSGAPVSAAQLGGMRMSPGEVLDIALRDHALHGAEAQIFLPALRERHFLLSAGPLSDESGRPIGCILTLTEITDRKRTETQQTMLVAELNHRVKNILAIVQSVAWQTLSANQSPADFKQAFDGRLRALSLAHDILTQGRWGHVEFGQLVERSLGPYYGAANGPYVQWSGARLLLPPNMVVPLSMVLHELSTNAAKYGAFSVEHGRVRIVWQTDGGNVRLTWVESGGPPVAADIRPGFGSKLISRVVSYDLAGAADLEFAPEGFRCALSFPLPHSAPRTLATAEAPPVH